MDNTKPDQPALPRSLIRDFAVQMYILVISLLANSESTGQTVDAQAHLGHSCICDKIFFSYDLATKWLNIFYI